MQKYFKQITGYLHSIIFHCTVKTEYFLNARTLSLPFKQFKDHIADTATLWSQGDCGKCQIYGPWGDWLMVLWCVWCFVLFCVCFLFSLLSL